MTALDTNQSGSASLIYSTYLGGDGAGALIGDIGDSVAVDGFGDAYLAGQTTSNSSGPFPTTSSAYQSTLNSPNGNAFIAEISTTQSGAQSLVYSSYFGGSTTSIVGDWGENVALDATGKVYITGGADSSDFPVTSGAFQTTNSEGGKAFAAKFDLTQSGSQSLVYSTFLGGTNGSTGENGNGIAVDSNGDAYVVGCTSSSDFPTTSDAFQSTLKSSGVNAYLSKLNPAGTGLQYSTYLGGSSEFGDVATSVALDSLTNPYVAGYTDSSDFPILNAFQSSLNGGQSGFVTKFALNANPGITASPSPGPNSAGWNNSAVTVTFTCVPGAAPIQSCSAPVTVSTEGANQVVTGMAVDTANNTASATDTVSLDLTPPVLTIVSPANNATVSTPYVIISGTLTDSLSGPGYVSCNGVPAALTSTNFSCTVQLSSVSNSITVTGYDLAGNSSTTTLNVTVSMSAPTSLTVSPANPNMVVGGTQAFTAVDQTGTSRPDATWSVSDTTIASFVSGSPNSLTGNAAGTVTLTATVGSVTGQTTVTVLAGSSLSVGTVLWTAVPPSGYTTQQIVQAVPTANGPDLYSLSYDSNGDIAFQALKANGQQLWQNSIAAADTLDYLSAFPNYSIHGAGDNSGGLLLTVTPQSYAWDPGAALTPLEPNFITDVNPQTGQTSWTYSATGALNSSIAVGLDGTVYAVESDMTQNPPNPNNGGYGGTVYLDVINGSSGALVNQIELPTSLVTIPQNSCDETGVGPTELYPGEYGSPVVAPDGSVYLEVGASQVTADLCTYVDSVNWTVSLLRISPGGGPQFQTLQTYSEMLADYSQGGQVGDVIPDGQGGVLATWTQEYAWPGCSSNCGMTIADIGSNGTVMSQFSSINLGEQFLDSNLVLGDAGTAFITDSTNVVSFNVSNLQQNWIYSSTSGGYDLSLLAATRGGGTAVNDSDLGLIQLDSSGNPSQVTGAPGSTPTFSFSNLWDIPAASSGGVSQIALPVVVDGASFWASPTGGASANRASYPLNPTLLQTTADPPPTCPLCNLQSPACTTLTGSGSTYLIIMGDQGINTTTGTHDVGNLFKLAAQTSANDLQASGHRVIACRASSVQEFNNALTQHGLIDGGVIFFGHSGQTVYSGDSALYSSLFVGQEAGLYTNITAKTVGLLSNSELGANIEILLNGCTAGAPTPDGNPPIALIIAKQLQRPVAGYSQDMHFSNLDASHDLTIAGPTQNPSGLPMYMNPDGAPPRPQPIYFYP